MVLRLCVSNEVRPMVHNRLPWLRHPLTSAVTLTLLAMVVSGCALNPTYAPRASDEWSNGLLLGTARLNNPVALQVDEAGDGFAVWVGLEHELIFARTGEGAQLVVEAQPLALDVISPLRPQLLMDSSGVLHLTWLDKTERSLRLFYARLSSDGEVLQDTTPLSPPEQRVGHSTMALDPVGRTVELFWSDNVPHRAGCYHTALDWSGAVVVPAELLIPDGILPVAQTDRDGYVHLAWRVDPEPDQPEFHYAVYDPQRRALGPEILATEPLIQMSLLGGPTAGASFDGPWLGLDQGSVYLAWVLEVRERGQVKDFTFYQAFPQPALPRRDDTAAFQYSPPEVSNEAVHVQGADPSLTGHPRFLEGQPEHQALACFTHVVGPGNVDSLQIAAVDLGTRLVEGQEIVNASPGASLRPTLAVDGQGHRHLLWIDTAGFERYQVVYATTSPQAKETLNRLTAYDVADKVFGILLSVITAMFFAPVVLAWVLIPVVWLTVFTWKTSSSQISDPRGLSALGLAMLLLLGAKVLFFSGMLARLSLAPPLSPSLAPLVGRWLLPLLLAAVSAGVMWIYLKRARSESIFAGYFVYAAVDSFLTLVVYIALPMA